MASTYEPIATTTLGSAASSIDFSSIPSTYTDLRIIMVMPAPTSSFTLSVQYNYDSGSNYSSTALQGDGTSADSFRSSNSNGVYITGPATSGFALIQFDLFSYRSSVYKSCLVFTTHDRNGAGYTRNQISTWRSTSAITDITFTSISGSGSYPAGTTATLYGIKAA